jgi:hypothetical protein
MPCQVGACLTCPAHLRPPPFRHCPPPPIRPPLSTDIDRPCAVAAVEVVQMLGCSISPSCSHETQCRLRVWAPSSGGDASALFTRSHSVRRAVCLCCCSQAPLQPSGASRRHNYSSCQLCRSSHHVWPRSCWHHPAQGTRWGSVLCVTTDSLGVCVRVLGGGGGMHLMPGGQMALHPEFGSHWECQLCRSSPLDWLLSCWHRVGACCSLQPWGATLYMWVGGWL